MTNGSSTDPVPIEDRPGSWKRRLKIGDLVVLIGILAVDLALLRSALSGTFFALIPLLGLLAIMVGFVWRYVPRGWDRPFYFAAMILYLLFVGAFVVASNAGLTGALVKALGIQ